jgi:alkaline phosphatase
MKYIFSSIILLFSLVACVQTEHEPNQNSGTAKNIILLIGDGMGVSHIYAGMTISEKPLNIEQFKVAGFAKTYSASDYITDSGASGTAIATGYKTYNKAIGVDMDTIPHKSILQYAEDNNKATGLVATSQVTHATPASFIAHSNSRYNYEDIAADYLKTDIDVFIGGGLKYFNQRSDSVDLTKELLANNYELALSIDEVLASKSAKIAGLLYDEHPPKVTEGRNDLLKKAGLKAIEVLNKNKNGFFMMIEGSQIDWAGHDKDNDYVVAEMIDFDNTVGAILDFAEKDGETLVIITADHETGGYALTDGDLKNGIVGGEFIYNHHTAVMVPIFAYGPGAENFTGMMENTDIFKKMYQLFGF